MENTLFAIEENYKNPVVFMYVCGNKEKTTTIIMRS